MSAQDLPPQGDPASPTCRHCGEARQVIRIVGATRHRACRTCDAPEVLGKRLIPTWEQA